MLKTDITGVMIISKLPIDFMKKHFNKKRNNSTKLLSNTNSKMEHTKIFCLTYIALLILAVSCTSNSKNQETNDSINDSIINAQLRTLLDSTLFHSDLNLKVEQLSISTSYTNNDTIKDVTGKGSTNRYNRYGNEKFDITGRYRVSHSMLNCESLKVDHSDVGIVFSIFEKYDTLLTYYMDSVTFSKKLNEYVEKRYEAWKDRNYKTEYAYANQTKVHFGISKDEYNRLGGEFQRNFYEGLIGEGAYELAEPIFKKGKFVGFEIIELHGKTFDYGNVLANAKLIKERRHGFHAHETFRWVYVCELYNMEIFSRYDKFERKTKHSIEAYWNEWNHMYDW